MKIFNSHQVRSADRYTIDHEPVSSIELMERAATASVEWILKHSKSYEKVAVFCGNGNNGGDGFAIARMLYLKGFDVNVFIDKSNTQFSNDALVNFLRLKDFSGISIKDFEEAKDDNSEQTILIDAIFGTGLLRKLEGKHKDVIELLNKRKQVKISIDIPSGLFADKISEEDSTVLQSDFTLSFQFWKKSFLHPETGKYTGKVIILDINLSKEYIQNTETHDFVISDEIVQSFFKPRLDFSHKGTYGKVIIAGGSYGKIGAAVMATKSALRTGAGLTFSIVPQCGYETLQGSCPEAMFIEGGDDRYIDNIKTEEGAVYGIGPGLGTEPVTEEAFVQFLRGYSKPLVIDADALNILSKDQERIRLLPESSIITPHPKEFERLFGDSANSFERLELARSKSRELNICIVLKDHHTQVITPDGKVYYNVTGNAGLAKGGSGDILTGIITSLLAQGYSEKEAAVFGVWLHGKAADYAADKKSEESMLPTDVIEELGTVFKEVNKKTSIKL
ncbi:NAD(P)H-hydrate dehydratase [Chryseobacterium sp.]|uniref:NAD(P)H-hydrate dehydratase n=1 Tax=Chryseobacterium sp. TaxID=1871047 RepID=UPI0025C090E3|nr:NAD(P)H-hydrate dehydratase [Chryseobacterium sp.]